MYYYIHRWNRTTRPQPHKFKQTGVSNMNWLILHLSKLVRWGSSWGSGIPISLVRHVRQALAGRAARAEGRLQRGVQQREVLQGDST